MYTFMPLQLIILSVDFKFIFFTNDILYGFCITQTDLYISESVISCVCL